MLEMSAEITKWKYYARGLQVSAILGKANFELNAELSLYTEQFTKLKAMLLTPPVLLSSVINDFHDNRENFDAQTIKAVEIMAKRVKVLDILTKLALSCGDENPGTKEVGIDFIDLSTPLPIKEAFKGKEVVLEQAIAEGREEAAKKVLLLTGGETPLMRYRKDLAKMKFSLSPTLDNGLLGYIPTKIENVDLKFWYNKIEVLPKLSFRISPF